MPKKDDYKQLDGKSLYQLYLDGDFDAGYYFSQLVFDAQYTPDDVAGVTKKLLREQARIDAENCVIAGAEANNVLCLIEVSDMYFKGRREPGSFGSKIFNAQYDKSNDWYQKLLETTGIDDEIKGLAIFRLGMLCKLRADGDKHASVPYWEAASKIDCEYQKHAIGALAFYYYDEKNYAVAVPLLESIYEKKPYLAMLLALCYEHGYGVDIDMKKNKELIVFWNEADDA